MTITIKRPEATLEFCPDLDARADWEAAVSRLDAAKRDGSGRLADTAIADAAREVRAAEDKMNGSILLFRLRAVPRKVWQEKIAANPPREGKDSDQAMGVDQSTFFDDLLSSVGTIVSVTEKGSGAVVDFDPATDWMPLADEMTDGQYAEFAQKVFELNRGVVAPGFSRSASLAMRDSEQS